MIMSCSSMGGSQFVLLCVKMFETALFDSFQTLDVDGVYRTHELVYRTPLQTNQYSST